MSKVSNLLKRAYRYCRYDLPEIVLPSSMPNPPHIEERLKQEREARLTLTQWREAFSEAVTTYREDYARFLGLRKEEGAAAGNEARADESEDEQASRANGAALKRDAGEVARATFQQLRPKLSELYRSRAAAYRDGLREFVLAYREAYAESVQQGDGGLGGAARPASDGQSGTGWASERGGGGGTDSGTSRASPDAKWDNGIRGAKSQRREEESATPLVGAGQQPAPSQRGESGGQGVGKEG